MKSSMVPLAIAVLMAAPVAFGGSGHDRTHDHCFKVTIQNDRVNESSVEQNCDRNINRTVQAGAENWSQTKQTGSINDNKVRQYSYDISSYFGRMRGR